jgi:protocatechuate 3,4-dioxygenase beta subunit
MSFGGNGMVRRSPSIAWLACLVQTMLRRPYSILPQRMELLPRFMRSVCRSPIWTKPPPRRRSGLLIGIRAPSSGMRFGNSWTTPITDAGLAAGESILLREEESDPLEMRGRVTDSQGRPIANALVEVWQTAPNQLYDVQDEDQPDGHLRGSFRTDGAGTFRFRTIMPVSYPIPNDGPAGQLLAAMGRHPFRPAHIHFMISAPRYRTLVTHLFLDGDKYLGSDAVFGVKPPLVIRPGLIEGINTVEYDFGLADERESTRAQVEELRRQRR